MMSFISGLTADMGRFFAEHAVLFGSLLGATALVALLGLNVIPTCFLKFAKNNEIKDAVREIMLTFDDGPDPQYTGRLLDLLRTNDVKATFFVLAEKADHYPELIDRMLAEGHQIGFHAKAHSNLWWMGPRKTRKNFREGLALLRGHGWDVHWYRPPFGNVTPWALSEMRENGLELQLWSVMAQDWRGDHTEAVILNKLRERVHPGSVICLHDSGEGSASPGQPDRTILALESFLPEMREKGYQFILPDQQPGSMDGKMVYYNALKRMGGRQ